MEDKMRKIIATALMIVFIGTALMLAACTPKDAVPAAQPEQEAVTDTNDIPASDTRVSTSSDAESGNPGQ
jgi:ABC-type oligopeptide transport system substrate-binding subunit